MLGIGSGYRPYEFEGLGKDFDDRRDMSRSGRPHVRRLPSPSLRPQGQVFQRHRGRPYEMLPQPIQMPHPPLYMAGGTDRSIAIAGATASA